jgi:putative DNA primase/helicase
MDPEPDYRLAQREGQGEVGVSTERSNLLDRVRGRWAELLHHFGIAKSALSGDNGPCPMCNGVDRFVFGDKHGSGSYHCRACGHGNGLALLRRFKDWELPTAMAEIAFYLDHSTPTTPPIGPVRDERSAAEKLAATKRLLREAHDPHVVEHWCSMRGLTLRSPALHGHHACPFYNRAYPRLHRHCFEAVVVPITAPYRGIVSAQRIYLSDDIPKKLRKKTMPAEHGVWLGAAARLFPPRDGMLGVAEGVATAMAAAELFGVPVWAALSDWGMRHWRPPPDLTEVMVFADNDSSGFGQTAAHDLEVILRAIPTLEVSVHIPPERDTDWNDVLLGRQP